MTSTPIPEPDWLSIGELARRLHVSVDTIRRWESDGKIAPAGRTHGGHRRYHPDTAVELETEREQRSPRVVREVDIAGRPI